MTLPAAALSTTGLSRVRMPQTYPALRGARLCFYNFTTAYEPESVTRGARTGRAWHGNVSRRTHSPLSNRGPADAARKRSSTPHDGQRRAAVQRHLEREALSAHAQKHTPRGGLQCAGITCKRVVVLFVDWMLRAHRNLQHAGVCDKCEARVIGPSLQREPTAPGPGPALHLHAPVVQVRGVERQAMQQVQVAGKHTRHATGAQALEHRSGQCGAGADLVGLNSGRGGACV